MSQDVSKSILIITQKAHGTYSGAIIDMMAEVTNVLSRFNHRLTKLENAQCCTEETSTDAPVSVPDVQDGISNESGSSTLSGPHMSKPTPGAPRKAKKGTTSKANKAPKPRDI
jgi:hypothetical protein